MSSPPFIITLDGPSASGKGTLAQGVAHALGFHYLDSGALYRALALFAQQQQVSWTNEPMLAQLANNLPIHFDSGEIFVADQPAQQLLRTESIGLGASQVSQFGQVRENLLKRQRDFAQAPGLVADGRDMGSVVFPKAPLKVYVDAPASVRAQRRLQQLGLSTDKDYADILKAIEQRDAADKSRAHAPLVPAKGARILDTSQESIDSAIEKILLWYQQTKNPAIIES